jgi:hypothetical protein
MAQLQLSQTECELLNHVLKNYLAALEVEICHTDHADFRASLKQRRELLTRIAGRLEQPDKAAAGG